MTGQPNIAAEVELQWADGKYLFALKLKQIEELQRLCGAGLGEIAQRLIVEERWKVCDIVETLRLGLIGGGTLPLRARELIDIYVDGRPLADPRDPNNSKVTAQAVIGAVYFGVEEDEPEGKAAAAAPEKGSSTSRRSTAKPSRSTSARSKSAA